MERKPFYRSKTLWTNFVFLVALIVQLQVGFVIGPEEQAAIITVVNLILRAFTGQGLTLKKQ